MEGKEDQILIKELLSPEVLEGPEESPWGILAAQVGKEPGLGGNGGLGLRLLGSQHRILQELEPKAGLVCLVQASIHLMDIFPIQSNPNEVFSQACFVLFVKKGMLLDKICLMAKSHGGLPLPLQFPAL